MDGNWTAKMDQGRQGAKDMAKLVAAFYAQLVEEGILPEDAAQITAAYCRSTVENIGRKQRREP